MHMADESSPQIEDTVGVEGPSAEAPASSGLGSLLGRAKAAREQAHSSMSGLANKASEVAVSKAGDLKGQVAAKAGELKDASLAKLAETLDDFNAALPVIREAGYTLSSVDIGVGIPPKVSATFLASHEVSAENVERLLVEHAEKRLTLVLVKALYQAWQLQTKIKIVGLQPRGLSVEIGLIPSVSVKFA
jgi:hypothetical protein